MSFLFPRNIVGFTTMEDLLVNTLQIQTQEVGGFSIYISDPTNPIFSVDGTTGTITTRGTLNVLGTASFQTITITNSTSSLFPLASNNAGDAWDIGLFGKYNTGSDLYSGVFRRASDPAKRWFFVNNFTATLPISVVPGITTANFAGVVGNLFSANDCNASSVAYGFFSDGDTGMYLLASNSLGFSAGSSNILRLTNTGVALEAKFDNTVLLYYTFLGTQNDIASSAGGGITTGSLTLQSTGLADKWDRYISTNPISAYAGSIYSFGSNSHYFITNSNGTLSFYGSTQSLGILTNPPDFRDSSINTIMSINNNQITFNKPITANSFRYNYTNNGNVIIDLSSDLSNHYINITTNTPTITLPNGALQFGREYVFIWKGTPGQFTLQSTGGSTIGGKTSPFIYSSTTYTVFKIVYDIYSNDWIFM
jgi:hypothetical protein